MRSPNQKREFHLKKTIPFNHVQSQNPTLNSQTNLNYKFLIVFSSKKISVMTLKKFGSQNKEISKYMSQRWRDRLEFHTLVRSSLSPKRYKQSPKRYRPSPKRQLTSIRSHKKKNSKKYSPQKSNPNFTRKISIRKLS